VAEGKNGVTPLNSLDFYRHQLDLLNELQYVSELPVVPTIQAVKDEGTKRKSV